jgi:hypothetical protein
MGHVIGTVLVPQQSVKHIKHKIYGPRVAQADHRPLDHKHTSMTHIFRVDGREILAFTGFGVHDQF